MSRNKYKSLKKHRKTLSIKNERVFRAAKIQGAGVFIPRNKYRNKKCTFDGIKFDSLREASYYRQLLLRAAAKEVQILSLQEKVYLTDAKILYKPDFKILDIKTGLTIWIDVKGARTVAFQIKKRLWKCYGPGPLHIIEEKKIEIVNPPQRLVSDRRHHVEPSI